MVVEKPPDFWRARADVLGALSRFLSHTQHAWKMESSKLQKVEFCSTEFDYYFEFVQFNKRGNKIRVFDHK